MKHLLILKVRFMIHQKNIKWLLFAHQVKLETHLKGAVNSTLFVDELEIIGE